jgi:hypothetical protein
MYLVINDSVKAATPTVRGARPFLAARALLLSAVLGAVLTGTAPLARAQCPPVGGVTDSATRAIMCRPDAALTRLFTPRAAPPGTYRVWVTATPLPRIAELLRRQTPRSDGTAGWTEQDLEPLDAFGDGGPYDRKRLARLYVGKRAKAARGPIVENGHTVASVWLISPYPDASLSRLEQGTLIIEFRIPREFFPVLLRPAPADPGSAARRTGGGTA